MWKNVCLSQKWAPTGAYLKPMELGTKWVFYADAHIILFALLYLLFASLYLLFALLYLLFTSLYLLSTSCTRMYVQMCLYAFPHTYTLHLW